MDDDFKEKWERKKKAEPRPYAAKPQVKKDSIAIYDPREKAMRDFPREPGFVDALKEQLLPYEAHKELQEVRARSKKR